MRLTITAFVLLFVGSSALSQLPPAPEKKEVPATNPLEESEALARQYLESFRQTGVPSSQAVTAAVEKAKQHGTIEAWSDAAVIANTYANVVDVLAHHYSTLYHASRSGSASVILKAADYEKIRNRYLQIRNNAYIELAKLYAAKGDKAKALSYAVTAVKLSEVEPNAEGEALIRQFIELKE